MYHILIHRQPDRKVTWVWEATGNEGKSWLADYLGIKRNAFIITGGAYKDIAHAFDFQETIVFDFSRDQQERVPYQLMEDFKNKRIFSPKYDSTVKRAVKCKLVVFANFPPEKEKLSIDRWDIIHLNIHPFGVPGAPANPALLPPPLDIEE